MNISIQIDTYFISIAYSKIYILRSNAYGILTYVIAAIDIISISWWLVRTIDNS